MIELPFESWDLKGFYKAPALLFSSIDSTHLEMKRSCLNLQDGTVIVANEQWAGKGRHFRKWESPSGKNLYFNILYPLNDIPLPKAPQLMQVSALSVAETLTEIGFSDIFVKWPNDIFFRKEKLGGIIAEILPFPNGNKISIGIGLNVNTNPSDLASIEKKATSLSIIQGRLLDRLELLKKILSALEKAYEFYGQFGVKPWLEKWKKMECFVGCEAKIVEGDKVLLGVILGIEEDGSLLIETEFGVKCIYSGDLVI